jgi:NADH-quinone oxidoreductase subunit G
MWHDAAVREIIQDSKGNIFLATVKETKLEDVASEVLHASPEDIARFGYAVAALIDTTLPPINGLSDSDKQRAKRIADVLMKASKPCVISGTSCESESVMKAAANIAMALQKKNPNVRLSFTLPECNSMGLAMMGGHRLHSAFDAILNGHADTVIVMENDLYRHGKTNVVEAFLRQCKRVIVIDHLNTATTRRADILLPAGTFAESDGTIVNNEGRAQRFFQIYEATDVIQESWRWLLAIGTRAENQVIRQWRNFEDVTKAISENEILLKGVEATAPAPDFRIAGQRIPREPHRYSGRTSMHADVNVSEPKPPEDPDSPLSYTMEGYRGMPPSSMIPFFWSPGWNSVQSVNKYQEEVGASLRGGDPGIRLLHANPNSTIKYFTDSPEVFQPMDDHLWIVPMHHIFGSDELSNHSKPVISRIEKADMLINEGEMITLVLRDNDLLSLELDGQVYELPVKSSKTLPRGIGAVPFGMEGLHFADLPAWANIIRKNAKEEAQYSTSAMSK